MYYLLAMVLQLGGDPEPPAEDPTSPWLSTSPWLLAFLTIVLLITFGAIIFATRKRPGRRYDRKPPGQAEGGLDDWGGRG